MHRTALIVTDITSTNSVLYHVIKFLMHDKKKCDQRIIVSELYRNYQQHIYEFEHSRRNLHATAPGKNPPCWKGMAMCCWNIKGLTPGWYMGNPVFPSATATRLYGIT